MNLRKIRALLIIIASFLIIQGCQDSNVEEYTGIELIEPIYRDLPEIKEIDTLVVLAPYNSTTYFIYRGEPLGYEYELLKQFAKDQDLHLKMKVVYDRDSIFYMLNSGEGDIAADRLVPGQGNKAYVKFSDALYKTYPAVVQQTAPPETVNIPESADTILTEDAPFNPPDSVTIRAKPIKKPEDLVNEEIFIPKRSTYNEVLVELEDTISGDIEVVKVAGTISTETLIRRVAKGEIELTVSQSNLASLKESYFTNISVRPKLGERHKVAWAVRKNSPKLLKALNNWIKEKKHSHLVDQLYDKYFIDRKGYRERVESEYLTSETGKLSEYDNLLIRYSQDIGWDWRLLASQTFQESRFKPSARSWAGAVGLLQLMPATARQVGVRNRKDPEDNIRGGVRYLTWIEEYWEDEIPDNEDKLKFILASYNAGIGHLSDARNLAEKYGDDPNNWNDVAFWLLQLSKRKYYLDPIVKYGYCRGLEPVTYVSLILDRYEHYKQFVTG